MTRKNPLIVYLKRVDELFFKKNHNEIIIQGIGAVVQNVVDLCLMIQEKYAGITLDVNTFTMPLKDVIIENDGVEDIKVGENIRFNSGICVKITKT